MASRRVLLLVPAEGELRDAAKVVAASRERAPLHRPPLGVPDEVKVDLRFAPVPIGRIGFTANMATATPEHAPQFVLRGEISAPDPAQAPHQLGQAQIFADPDIGTCSSGCDPGPIGTDGDVRRLLQLAELHRMGLDGRGTAIALMDTGINLEFLRGKGLNPQCDPTLTWSPVFGIPGQYHPHHGTMCAYDCLMAAPNAMLLDFPVLLSASPEAKTIHGSLSDALQAYSLLYNYLRQPADRRAYRSIVISNSWAMYHQSWDFEPGHPGRYADNPNHPFNLMVGTISRAGADVLFVAGNCGADCPDQRCLGVTQSTIMGANAHPDVITIAGVAVDGARVGFSSQGPGILGMAHAKPDLAAYTHFRGSEVFGAGTPDSGTSAACPVAAGAVAALRSAIPADLVASRDLSRELRHDAVRPSGFEGWTRDYGYGIVNPLNTAKRMLSLA